MSILQYTIPIVKNSRATINLGSMMFPDEARGKKRRRIL